MFKNAENYFRFQEQLILKNIPPGQRSINVLPLRNVPKSTLIRKLSTAN